MLLTTSQIFLCRRFQDFYCSYLKYGSYGFFTLQKHWAFMDVTQVMLSGYTVLKYKIIGSYLIPNDRYEMINVDGLVVDNESNSFAVYVHWR